MDSKSTMFEWDANTPYANRFALKGNFVAKVHGESRHQMVVKNPLPKGLTIIKATIKHYGESGQYVGFGLLTESRRNEEQSGFGPQSAALWTWNNWKQGWIPVDGNQIVDWTDSLFISPNESVLMEVNMDQLSVRWKAPKEEQWRGAYQLSEEWKGKNVYLFVAMNYNGSSVECSVLQ